MKQEERGVRSSTILVVEDETITRLMLVEELETQGHTVLEAADAEAALMLLRENAAITVLFTDVRMPGKLDGLDLAVLARMERPALKIVIASGHMRLSEWRGRADAVFAKPFDLPALVTRINQLASLDCGSGQ